MTKYEGGMLKAIELYLEGKTTRKFGVLLIDEQSEDNKPNPRTAAQLKVLALAWQRSLKTILIEINPKMTAEARKPTNSALAREAPPGTEVFFKAGFNAFGRIDSSGKAKGEWNEDNKGRSLLDASLRQAGVNELIIMGRVGQQCVKLTAVGGSEKRNNAPPVTTGATGFGYQVWTCPLLIDSGGSPWLDWYDQFGVKCYTAL